MDPYMDPERRFSRRTNLTKIEAKLGDITFALTGPPDQVNSIVKFIRNLVHMTSGKPERYDDGVEY